MKRTVKLIAALLTLVMLMSILPVTALADTNEGIGVPGEAAPAKTEVTVSAVCYNSNRTARIGTYSTKELSAKSITIDYETFGKYIKYNGRTYEFYTVKYNSKGHGSVVLADGKAHEVTVMYVPHTHKYTPRHDRIYHWDGCSCGKKLNVERHVNPATDDDSICTCGYQFSDNADLVTLWLSNMVLDTRFKPEITEYNAEIYTYKKVSSTQIKVRTFDALATVEKPTNLTVQDGLNVYQVTVTAEDCKTTKTYTVYAYRPVTVDGMDISTVRIEDEVASILAPKATSRKCIATYTLSETVAKAMAEQSKLNEGTQVILQPSFNKWADHTLIVTVPAAGLKAIAESKADFIIRTWKGDVIVPNGELAAIAGQGENVELTLSFSEGLTCSATVDGNAIDSGKITVK